LSNPNNSFVSPPKKLLQNKFDKFAEEIIKQLQKNGHDAYLVGGCIRDQLINIPAKDFDVATSATPEQIRKIFKASRIIGKRFKLVHVYKGSQVIEVSTFRASGMPLLFSDPILLVKNLVPGYSRILRLQPLADLRSAQL
jgi:tRNA nucleotidyltransferase/poly(A) polymerase